MTRSTTESTPPTDGDLDQLLAYIHERRNFDFRAYKKASLSRRITKRMQAVGAPDYQGYMAILEANPGEYADLFDTILINVTSFLRDSEAWETLAKQAVTAIGEARGDDEPIRVWSAGCASGEEAYSLAVLFAEQLGEERLRTSVKIYATDADEGALGIARHARYPLKDILAAFGRERATRFFEEEADQGVFRSDLRKALIFGRHDLVQDPPISRIDLLVCRNTLMYFTSEVQGRILANFHFALQPDGFLFLGKSEALASRSRLFDAVDLRQHLFRRDGTQVDITAVAPGPPVTRGNPKPGRNVDALFEQAVIAQVLLDSKANVVLANREARRLLGIGSSDIGRPFREFGSADNPTELKAAVDRAMRQRQPVTISGVNWHLGLGRSLTLDIVLAPAEAEQGIVVSYVDVSRYQQLREELEGAQTELESAYEELQSAVEELETTNEELQSAVEELETTNEELQSTNEELETTNEELQSTNEELETMNTELRSRSEEVDELNHFLQSILGSLKSAVVVLGDSMEVRAWNRQAQELWGLRADEVIGQHFLNLDIGFPVEKLRSHIRACITGKAESAEIVEEAVNRRGKAVRCTVNMSRLFGDTPQRGVLLMMDAELL